MGVGETGKGQGCDRRVLTGRGMGWGAGWERDWERQGGDGVQVDGRRGDRALPKGRWEMVRAKRSKTPWEV